MLNTTPGERIRILVVFAHIRLYPCNDIDEINHRTGLKWRRKGNMKIVTKMPETLRHIGIVMTLEIPLLSYIYI